MGKTDISTEHQSTGLSEAFKKVMRRHVSTVTIIATQEEFQPYGMIATAVTSVSASPPAILVCINRGASIYSPCVKVGRFTVNMLAEHQLDLISAFSGGLKGQARFQYGKWSFEDNLPYLGDAQSTLFCTIENRTAFGTHDVIIARVDQARVIQDAPMLLWADGQPATPSPIPI
ncbi:flavin reductase [Kosakonia cowanii]|nr:flavin reductase [Kosakonia cowanii]